MNTTNASFISNTVTKPVTRVSQAQVWNFVRNTPEGTALWNALTRWRRHYDERLQVQVPKKTTTKRKSRTGKINPSDLAKPPAYFKMKHSYSDCLLAFKRAMRNESIRNQHHAELVAIAMELGIEVTPEVQQLIEAHTPTQLKLF